MYKKEGVNEDFIISVIKYKLDDIKEFYDKRRAYLLFILSLSISLFLFFYLALGITEVSLFMMLSALFFLIWLIQQNYNAHELLERKKKLLEKIYFSVVKNK